MKNRTTSLFVLTATAAFLLFACKDEPVTTTTTKPKPTPVDTVVCSGNGSNTFYPLVQGNKWSYTSASSGNPILIVNGQNVLGGKNYINVSDQTQKLYSVDLPLREDPVTHDIYTYNTSTDKEYLEVPGSPTIDQSWARAGTITRKVTNLSASLTTSKCSYTGLLEVTVFDNGVAGSKYYYKKGLGPVAILGFNLSAVTLN